MKYILLIYGAEDCWTEDERKACMIESLASATSSGPVGSTPAPHRSSRSRPPPASACGTAGRSITDGPFAETTEQLGGYYLLDLADLDEAIAVAASVPPAAKGTVEIRPLVALEGLPPDRPLPTATGDASPTPFLLLCYDDEAAWEAAGPQAVAEARAEAMALARRLSDEGRYLSASPLRPAATATCVSRAGRPACDHRRPFRGDARGPGRLLPDPGRGPRHGHTARRPAPGARVGTVEVRPLFDMSRLGKSS